MSSTPAKPKAFVRKMRRGLTRKPSSRRRLQARSTSCRARRSSINIKNGGRTTCSKSKVVSDKLEALKSLIPAYTDETVKPDQLFQETADYIVLLKTQVVILQRLLQFYGSSTVSDNVVS
ncbi:hypothetical protein ACB094_01G230900 [Castanea mollissima]